MSVFAVILVSVRRDILQLFMDTVELKFKWKTYVVILTFNA